METKADFIGGRPMPEGLRCYQPDLKYLLIDENRYTHQELERLDNLTAIQDLTEMHTMLSERVKEWSHLHRQAGLKEGLEQGLERGIELGEARTLKRLLTKRFGELPADVLQQIDSATLVQLEVWLDRVLDADSLAAVLD
ncbi:DUF4351 domain-containing protein [Allohahella sp. A8]|uniref:DUF4351 domain-containing protein n=1 Tax=Allohahella sp. A8 TaxID=3141461 RepID=UPI003A7FC1D4